MAWTARSYEGRLTSAALIAAGPAVLVAAGLLAHGEFRPLVVVTLAAPVLAGLVAGLLLLRARASAPVHTLANLAGALAEGDTSMRARDVDPDDSLGLAFHELARLRDALAGQRLVSAEASALLRRLLEEIDVAVIGFDERGAVSFSNRTAEDVLGREGRALLGCPARELGLEDALDGDTPRVLQATFPGRAGRWQLRRGSFREGGLPHTFVVLSDLSPELAREEREAWRRLVRVLSHEINNSLAPIASIADTLQRGLAREGPDSASWRTDATRGLAIVGERARSLADFIAAYARLARLPAPTLEDVDLAPLVERVAALEQRLALRVLGGPAVCLRADAAQLEQLLINLIGNAVEAATEGGGQVELDWRVTQEHVEVRIVDDGPGIEDGANLFVPFYSTKPGGSGIGLALARQIAEGHGGQVTLERRTDGSGCVARVVLPVQR